MLCSSFWSTVTGLPVLVRSFSTCLGVNTQHSEDSCTHTGLPVLVGSVTLSCFSWLRVSRSNLERSRVSSHHFVTSPVLPYLIIGFFGFSSIRWMSLLLLATSESKSHVQISWKEIVGGGRGDTYTFWYMISSDFITIAFEIQWAGSVSWRMTALHLVW